jgi:hypothetical protein
MHLGVNSLGPLRGLLQKGPSSLSGGRMVGGSCRTHCTESILTPSIDAAISVVSIYDFCDP